MKWIRVAGIALAIVTGTISIYLSTLFSAAILRAVEVAIVHHLPPGVWTQINYFLSLLWILVFWALRKFLLRLKIVANERIRKMDSVCSVFLEQLLPRLLAIGIVLGFLSWFPHYSFWPWWMDLEHFAVSARMWDLGVRPYRDLIDFNFPGPIYFMWILGKTIGWDKPMAANVIDGLVALGLCMILLIWSRKRFGSMMAGLFASSLILRYYFSLDYARVMQRDWYVAVIGILSICLIQFSRSKHRWIAAGILMSVAGIIRPYAILFLLPIGLAIWLDRDDHGRTTFRKFMLIGISMAAGTIVLWMPLVIHGMFDDFLTTFAEAAMSDKYRSKDQESMIGLLIRQANTKIVFTSLAGLLVTSFVERRNPDRLRTTVVWLLALVSVLFYMPICPVRHAYTEIPAEVVACVGCGLALKCLIEQANWAGSVKFVAVLVWFTFHFPGLPQFCNFRDSIAAVRALASGEMLKEPPGCRYVLGSRNKMGPDRYCWDDYADTIDYVRSRTSPDTYVVNFLWLYPHPTINGPTGRPILWPCAEGLLWVQWVDPSLEMRFAESLVTDREAIAITHDESIASQIACPFPNIAREIETSFEEIARFGKLRVSKRKSERVRSTSKTGSGDREKSGTEDTENFP